MNQAHKVQTGVFLTVAISMIIVLCVPSTVTPAKASKMGDSTILSIEDFSGIPQEVIDDAVETAASLFDDDEEKCQGFIRQVLALYREAEDVDVVVIVNSGGWGWSPITDSNEKGLAPGIDEILRELGNSTLWIDYYRTEHSFYGAMGEFMMAFGTYPQRAQELAARTEFLTDHLPDLKVILLGISNGCTICSGAMPILKENGQVYSIQLGPPFWNDTSDMERVLLLRSNGTIPDSFSNGYILTIIRANLEAAFGISQEYAGNILLYIGAPGHDYDWEYEELQSRVTEFLTEYFSAN